LQKVETREKGKVMGKERVFPKNQGGNRNFPQVPTHGIPSPREKRIWKTNEIKNEATRKYNTQTEQCHSKVRNLRKKRKPGKRLETSGKKENHCELGRY